MPGCGEPIAPDRAPARAHRRKARLSVSCEPMWQSTPVSAVCPAGRRLAVQSGRRCSISMPNLFSLQAGGDVGMCAGIDVRVHAQRDRRASAPVRRPTPFRRSSSASDSTLKQRIPAISAVRISSASLSHAGKQTPAPDRRRHAARAPVRRRKRCRSPSRGAPAAAAPPDWHWP